ncbi:hypothetical protein [Nocardia nepalensis]|uniref:hypothetical protein n=1 Tax=Nocardia nepalensis TaxID=3375448 RepID=UPI003B6719CD
MARKPEVFVRAVTPEEGRRLQKVAKTYSSWLNWIESEFTALRYFALNGADHRSHGEQDDAIAAYIRWRNQHAEPKRDFAVDSKIRLPHYLPYVA